MLFPCIPSCVLYISAATPFSPKSVLAFSYLDGFWVWTFGLRLSGTALGRALIVSLPQSLIWVPTCILHLWACESGTPGGWWPLWWTWQGIVWASPPAIVSKFLFGCSDKFLSHNLIVNIIYSLLFPAKSNEFVFFELSQPLTEWEEDRLTEVITRVSKRNRAPDLAEFLSLEQALPLLKDLSPEESSFLTCNKYLLKQYMPKENTSDDHESVIQVSG